MSYDNQEIKGDLTIGRNISAGGRLNVAGASLFKGKVKIDGILDAKNIKGAEKGLFASEEELNDAYPNPYTGWHAIVIDPDDETKGFLYRSKDGAWYKTSEDSQLFQFLVDTSNVYATQNELEITEAALQDSIAAETTRATKEESELLKRIQGTSDSSSALYDPFKRLSSVEDVDALLAVLNEMHSTSANNDYNGHFRIRVSSKEIDIFNNVLEYEPDVWVQEIRGPFEIYQTHTSKSTSLDNGDYYYAVEYTQALRVPTQIDYRGGTRTLRRMHNGDAWSEWVDTTNPYLESPLYGKNVLLLGGSFAHNMRGTGTSSTDFGFTVLGRTYSLQNYIAEKLNLKHFDNYAISGNGACIDSFTYSTYTQLEAAIAHAAEEGYEYDAIILFGGINDYAANTPLGSQSDDKTGTSTFWASYKKVINLSRLTYKNVRLFIATPFKGFSKTEYWNPLATTKNDVGYRYYEYVQALKEIAHYASIPLLDVFSIHQVDTNNYGRYTRYDKDDTLHPNGAGYYMIAPALIEFLAWGKGAETFSNDALQMNLQNEIIDNKDDIKTNLGRHETAIENNATAITNETTRATKKESELLKRIQGTSDSSSALYDPFKYVGRFITSSEDYPDMDDFNDWLDGLHSASSSDDIRGVYRAICNDGVVEIHSCPISYSPEHFVQVIRGRVSVSTSTGKIVTSNYYNILQRDYTVDADGVGAWGEWVVVASAATLKTMQATIAAQAELIASLITRIEALEEKHSGVAATVSGENLTLDGEVSAADGNITLTGGNASVSGDNLTID